MGMNIATKKDGALHGFACHPFTGAMLMSRSYRINFSICAAVASTRSLVRSMVSVQPRVLRAFTKVVGRSEPSRQLAYRAVLGC